MLFIWMLKAIGFVLERGIWSKFKNFKQTYLNHKQHYFYVESQ